MTKKITSDTDMEDIITNLYNEYIIEQKKVKVITTREEILEAKKTSNNKLEKANTVNKKEEYKRVKKYEKPTEKIENKKSFKPFKTGLAIALLSAVLVAGKGAYDKTNDVLSNSKKDEFIDLTFETADNTTKQLAQDTIDTIKNNSGYEFDNLSNEELLESFFKIVPVERNMHITVYQSHLITQSKDQILLEKILKQSYGEEAFSKFSSEKVRDLKKMAYELLSENPEKQVCIRDPERVREAEEKYNNSNTEREIGD